MRTGIEKNSQYGVDRPFNLLEPIPMKIGQRVNQFIKGSYESTIAGEATANLKENGFTMDVVRTVMAAKTGSENENIVLGYDKETGMLITHIEKYVWEGKQHNSKASS